MLKSTFFREHCLRYFVDIRMPDHPLSKGFPCLKRTRPWGCLTSASRDAVFNILLMEQDAPTSNKASTAGVHALIVDTSYISPDAKRGASFFHRSFVMASNILPSRLLGITFWMVLVIQASSALWKLKPSGYGGGQNMGSYGGGYGQWGGGYGGGWSSAWPSTGIRNEKGGGRMVRTCYDNRQCSYGECCRNSGYGGHCDYVGNGPQYGCVEPRPIDWWQKPTYPQRPVYPQRPIYPQKPGGWQPPVTTGRGGFCPPQAQWQGSTQLCRFDQDCPSLQKCCPVQGKQICMHPVFPSP